ncbi:MAG: hypoxanthine-guanine phosphoribosyltransferase [Methylotenera sp.]
MTANPLQYLAQAELIHSEQAVNQAISGMAEQLSRDYATKSPVVLCVMGGALFFTGQLLPKLQFPLELDYVQASRYQDGTEGKMLKWVVKPKQNIKNRNVLILDDILDEGITLHAIVEQCRLLGASEIKTAVLVEKNLSKNKPIQANYVGLSVPNRYVFGCGMDVYGWWRNVPAIYALNNA